MKNQNSIGCVLQLFVGFVVMLFAGTYILAGNFYVDGTSGLDSNDGLSWATAFATPDAGISAANVSPGADDIFIAGGTYLRSTTLFLGNDMGIFGGYPSGGGIRDIFANSTLIKWDPGAPFTTSATPVIVIDAVSSLVLDGFDIQGGKGNSTGIFSNSTAGGVTVRNSTNITIQNNRISQNGVEDKNIDGCTWWTCPNSTYGGGMLVYNSSGLIKNNVFYNNWANPLYYFCDDTIPDCAFMTSCGSYGWGGGAYLNGFNGEFSFNTLSANSAAHPAGIPTGGGLFVEAGTATVLKNNILWGNDNNGNLAPPCTTENDDFLASGSVSEISYSDIGVGFVAGTGNISLNPFFVSGPFGNYYLSQVSSGQALNSACVDAGSNTSSALGMISYTTRTDSFEDTGTSDMGYHAPIPYSDPFLMVVGPGDSPSLSWQGGRPMFTVYHSDSPTRSNPQVFTTQAERIYIDGTTIGTTYYWVEGQ